MVRMEHSRNQGLVRGPEDSSRVSIHSPPRRILVSCSLAQRLGPERVLGDAGFERRVHRAHAGLADRDCRAHQIQLLRRFDRAGVLGDRFARHHLQAPGAQRVDAEVGQPVDREPPVAAAVFGDQIGDLIAEYLGLLRAARPGGEIVERRHHPVVVDRRQALGQMRVVGVVEQHHRALGGDEDAAGLVMGAPDLHVGGVGGVDQICMLVASVA
jgi:hypothetical protein